MLDTTVVNVALPSIMNDFNASLDRAQLVVTMYLVALALIIPTTGYFTDRLGAKRLYTLSIAGFTLGSVLCGLAWDINSLIFFRIIQGLAGGITMPLGIALIFRTVPREEQGAIVSLTVAELEGTGLERARASHADRGMSIRALRRPDIVVLSGQWRGDYE